MFNKPEDYSKSFNKNDNTILLRYINQGSPTRYTLSDKKKTPTPLVYLTPKPSSKQTLILNPKKIS